MIQLNKKPQEETMKKLAIILAIALVVSLTGVGVLFSQKNQANTDIKGLEVRLQDTQNTLETTSKDAKTKADALAAQVADLSSQLETEKANALQAETEAKALSDGLAAQVETLTAELTAAKAEALKAEEAAKANADALNTQIESLTSQLETAKASALQAVSYTQQQQPTKTKL